MSFKKSSVSERLRSPAFTKNSYNFKSAELSSVLERLSSAFVNLEEGTVLGSFEDVVSSSSSLEECSPSSCEVSSSSPKSSSCTLGVGSLTGLK